MRNVLRVMVVMGALCGSEVFASVGMCFDSPVSGYSQADTFIGNDGASHTMYCQDPTPSTPTLPGTSVNGALLCAVDTVTKAGNCANSGATTKLLPAPPGWSDANTPPSTAQQSLGAYWYDMYTAVDGHYSSGQSVCDARGVFLGGEYLGNLRYQKTGNYSDGNEYGTCTILLYGILKVMANPRGATGCPDGYSVSGSSCVLTNANLVKWPTSDGQCEVKRSGNAFTVHPNDPDCTNSPKNVVTATSNSQSDTDGSGVTTTINSDGTTKTTQKQPNANGTTTTTNTDFSAPKSGGGATVIGFGQSTNQGTGLEAGNTPATETGLAKDGTVQGLRADTQALGTKLDGIKGNGDAIKGALTGGNKPSGVSFSTAPTYEESGQRLYDGLNNYRPIAVGRQMMKLSVGSGACPVLSVDTGQAWFGVLSTDLHCRVMENNWAFIQSASRLFFALVAAFIFLGA